MLKVLVTGGSGFIGSALIRRLMSKYGPDIHVTSVDVVPPAKRAFGVEYHTGTILDKHLIARTMKDCDAVFHLAAMTGVKRCTENPVPCLNVNIGGTQTVLDAAVSRGVKRVFFASSSEVYGSSPEPVWEHSPRDPKSEYAVSKLAGEELVKAYSNEYGIGYSIGRFFNIYGPGQVAKFVMPIFAKQIKSGEPITVFGDGNALRTFCYIDDAVDAIEQIGLRPDCINQTFNVGNEIEPITMDNLAHLFLQVFGAGTCTRVPYEKSDRTQEREIFNRRPHISRLKSRIQYAPTVHLREGIQLLLDSPVDIPTWVDDQLMLRA